MNFFLKIIQNLIAPYFCINCKKILEANNILCSECIKDIKPKRPFFIKITNKYMLKVYILSEYKNSLKQLVLAKNYFDTLASKQLASLIWKLTDLKNQKFDYLVPIPLHWTRYAQRGFNQSEIIASMLSKKAIFLYGN